MGQFIKFEPHNYNQSAINSTKAANNSYIMTSMEKCQDFVFWEVNIDSADKRVYAAGQIRVFDHEVLEDVAVRSDFVDALEINFDLKHLDSFLEKNCQTMAVKVVITTEAIGIYEEFLTLPS